MRTGAFDSFPEHPQPQVGLGSPPVGVGQYGNLVHSCPAGQTWDNTANFGAGGCVLIAQVSPPPPPAPPPPPTLPTTIPPASINQTQNYASWAISVAPCHSVTMVVFPIPHGSSVKSDPKTILEDLGFTVTGIGRAPSGGVLVNATLTSGQPYKSNPADMVLVYSGGNGTFQSGETVTQGGTWGGVVSWVNNDPASGSGSLGLSSSGGQGPFDPTSTIIGSSSGAYATSIFLYEVVLVSPKGHGRLGVTNFTDNGDNGLPTWSSNEKKCVKVVLKGITPVSPCPPGTTYNIKTFGCDCPAGLSWSSNENKCVKVVLMPIRMNPCPDGQSMVNGQCQCPAGQSLVNGQCIQTNIAILACPAGQHLVNGQCMQNISSTYTPPIQPAQPPPPAPSTGMSTGTMIAIGVVALGAIGGAAWWYMQKHKPAALPAAPPASPASELMFQNPFQQGCSTCGPSYQGFEEAAPNPRRRRRARRAR